jgi:hypothetical protein
LAEEDSQQVQDLQVRSGSWRRTMSRLPLQIMSIPLFLFGMFGIGTIAAVIETLGVPKILTRAFDIVCTTILFIYFFII